MMMKDLSISLTADRFPLVRDIGKSQTDGIYTHHDRILDFDVFLFVTKGRMQVIEEGTEYFVGEMEHLFLKKGRHHWGRPLTLPGTTWYWIHFNTVIDEHISYSDHLPMAELDYYFPDQYQYRLDLPKHGTSVFHLTLENHLQKLLEDYEAPRENGMTLISLQAYQLFLELRQAELSRTAKKTAGKTNRVAGKVMGFLTRHVEEDFDSKLLSTYVNLNYSYLSATFKKITGQNIVEAHTKLRMNKAIHLMRSTSMNVSEISERLGYRNPFYFSRVFKKVLGEAPSTYMSRFYKP
ncbi:helix-turn-helix domain-containing protein [Cohnella sp.]|uniref:helix-turn-helix domain-containing protein n=1 Tax=Cohnella sp. TaxID=1883426 RepID=UPI003567F55C